MENNLKLGDKLYYLYYQEFLKCYTVEFHIILNNTNKYILKHDKVDKDTLKSEKGIQYFVMKEQAVLALMEIEQNEEKDIIVNKIKERLDSFDLSTLSLNSLNNLYNIIK